MQKPAFAQADGHHDEGHGDSISDVEQRAGDEFASRIQPPISWTAARFLVTEQGRTELLASSHICYDGRALDEEG